MVKYFPCGRSRADLAGIHINSVRLICKYSIKRESDEKFQFSDDIAGPVNGIIQYYYYKPCCYRV